MPNDAEEACSRRSDDFPTTTISSRRTGRFPSSTSVTGVERDGLAFGFAKAEATGSAARSPKRGRVVCIGGEGAEK